MMGSTCADGARSFVCSSKSGYLGGSLEVCPLRALGKQLEIIEKSKSTTGQPNIFCKQLLHTIFMAKFHRLPTDLSLYHSRELRDHEQARAS